MSNNERNKRSKTSLINKTDISEIGKLPPQAIELEEAVLGAALLERDALNVIIDILTPESFYKEQNGKVFQAVLNLFKASEPIDILTVTQELKRMGELEFVGGSYYVSSLTNRIASSANIEFHARIVAQKFLQRELIRVNSKTIRLAYEDSSDVFELFDEHEKEITSIVSGISVSKGQTSSNLYSKVLERNQKIIKNPNSVIGVPSGFYELDSLTNGWQKSDLIILAARPGMGKSAKALSLAKTAALKGHPVAIFSLEMSAEQLYIRLASQETEIPHEIIKEGMDVDTETLFKRDMEALRQAPLFIDDSGALSVFQLRNRARKLKQEEKIELIVIDYLQLMTGVGDEGNREQEVSNISRGLKALAKELDIPIIALSQLSRQVENRPGGGKRPQLSDLRDSGSIEQDADMVMFIYRPEYYGITVDDVGNSTLGVAEIIIAKNRHGKTTSVYLKFIGKLMKFVNLNDKPADLIALSTPSNLPQNDQFLRDN